MVQWIGKASALLLCLAGLPVSSLTAKPADLPGDVTQHCPEGRDGQQAEGFSRRPHDGPSPAETVMPRLLPERSREPGLGRLPADRQGRAERLFDLAEEQEAPPQQLRHRESSEGRRGNPTAPGSNSRVTGRSAAEEAPRREMLRSTQPLETQPQRPQNGEVGSGRHPIRFLESDAAAESEYPEQVSRGAGCCPLLPTTAWTENDLLGIGASEPLALRMQQCQSQRIVHEFIDRDGTIKTVVVSPAGFAFSIPLDVELLTAEPRAAYSLRQQLGHVAIDFILPPQPLLVLVYRREESASTPDAGPGIQGDFDLTPNRFIF